MKRDFGSKVVVITGGGGGIGSAAGKLFCEAGAAVALVDLDPSAARDAATRIRDEVPSADIEAFAADLGIEDEAGRVAGEIASARGTVDILINNAGIRNYEPVADAPWSAWDPLVRVNLLSFAAMSRAVLPAMRAKASGSIINVSSTYALYGREGMGIYDATKAAVLALTRTLAFEEARHGIRVNAICPGFTRTPFHVKRMGQEAVDSLVPPCALKRWAEPVELAYPLLWLASDEASYVTSATFMIDGGLPARFAAGPNRRGRKNMKLQFHHMNLCSENVSRLSEFYRSVLDLGSVEYTRVNTTDGYGGNVDFVTDGAVEFHLARRDVDLGFRMKHFINPLDRGHFCFRTDDIEAFKRRLEEKKIPYSDYGTWAMKGWYQIFFHDPEGNIIEVHQTGK